MASLARIQIGSTAGASRPNATAYDLTCSSRNNRAALLMPYTTFLCASSARTTALRLPYPAASIAWPNQSASSSSSGWRCWSPFGGRPPTMAHPYDDPVSPVTPIAIDPVLAVVLVLVSATTALARAWITHRTAVRKEEGHTERVRIAVTGSTSEHRAAVVRAGAQLEAAARPQSAGRRRPRSP